MGGSISGANVVANVRVGAPRDTPYVPRDSRYVVRAWESRYFVRAQHLFENLRTCQRTRDASYVPVDTRDFVRVRWYLEPLETQTSKKPIHQGSTVIPEPLAWHILPSDANLRKQPMGEKTLNLP